MPLRPMSVAADSCDTGPHREDGKLNTIVHVELGQYVGYVVLHCLATDAEHLRDLVVLEAACQKRNDLDLAVTHVLARDHRHVAGAKKFEDRSDRGWLDPAIARMHSVHG